MRSPHVKFPALTISAWSVHDSQVHLNDCVERWRAIRLRPGWITELCVSSRLFTTGACCAEVRIRKISRFSEDPWSFIVADQSLIKILEGIPLKTFKNETINDLNRLRIFKCFYHAFLFNVKTSPKESSLWPIFWQAEIYIIA